MQVNEWALVAFTILSQMSVGTFLVLGVVYFFARRKWGVEAADKLSDRALLAIGPVIILAFIASLFHLGNPFNAYRAVSNLGASWLSREILSGVLFAITGGLFALMQWRKIGSNTLRTIIAVIAALIGLFFVYAMSNVYMMRTVPTWNTWYTPASFFTTTFLLGAMAVSAAYVATYAYLSKQETGQCRSAERNAAISTLLDSDRLGRPAGRGIRDHSCLPGLYVYGCAVSDSHPA